MNRVKFFDSLTVDDLLQRAKGDTKAAEQLLLMAAEYLRGGEIMPSNLADYLANAFEVAVNNPARRAPNTAATGDALLTALHLKHQNRPKTGVNPFSVCALMFDEMLYYCSCEAENKDKCRCAKKKIVIEGDGVSIDVSPANMTQAAKLAAQEFGISESTAKRYYINYIDKYLEKITALPPDEEEKARLAYMQELEIALENI